MVLITDDIRHRITGGSIAQVHPSPSATRRPSEEDHQDEEEDEYLDGEDDDGEEEEEEEEDEDEDDVEEVDFEDLYDTRSIVSDDSFYPPDDLDDGAARRPSLAPPAGPVTFHQACCRNNAAVLRTMLRQGVSEGEVMETDRNKRTGLMVACYQGYVDIVILLSQCPHLDVNWQDSEGNTALITAAQAGHMMITNYLLNYYTGLDLERRNCHGFTALMKAAMQGRTECVRALMTAGADMSVRDYGRKMTAREWAWFTGRYETAWVMARLVSRPCPRQMSGAFSLEWPQLRPLVARAQEPRGCVKRVLDQVKSTFSFANITNPVDHGAMDHLVATTTALRSPFIAVACHTVCPESPPCVGVRRYAVPEILRSQRAKELQALDPHRNSGHHRLFENSRVTLVHKAPSPADRRASLQVAPPAATANTTTTQSARPQPRSTSVSVSGNSVSDSSSDSEPRRTSLMPLHTVRRSSVRPGFAVPKVRVTKAPAPPAFQPEKARRKSSYREGESNLLQIPKWRYKELKEERRKAEEAERRRMEASAKKHLAPGKRK